MIQFRPFSTKFCSDEESEQFRCSSRTLFSFAIQSIEIQGNKTPFLQFECNANESIKNHSMYHNNSWPTRIASSSVPLEILFFFVFFFLLDCFVFPFSYFGRLKRSDAEWSCGNGWLPIHPELEIGGCDSDFFFFSSFVVRRRPSPPIHRPNRATVCGRLVPEHRPYRYVNTLRTVRR